MLELFRITNAAMIPGIHPHNVKTNTIKKNSQPLSKTEKGGNMKDIKALQKLKILILQLRYIYMNEKNILVVAYIRFLIFGKIYIIYAI